jgi:hypothetical protein
MLPVLLVYLAVLIEDFKEHWKGVVLSMTPLPLSDWHQVWHPMCSIYHEMQTAIQ